MKDKNLLECYDLMRQINGEESILDFSSTGLWIYCRSMAVILSMLSILIISSLNYTCKKYELITRINPTQQWDQTYCLLSKYLVIIVMVGTPICFICCIQNSNLYYKAYRTHIDENGHETCNFNEQNFAADINWILLVMICDMINFV